MNRLKNLVAILALSSDFLGSFACPEDFSVPLKSLGTTNDIKVNYMKPKLVPTLDVTKRSNIHSFYHELGDNIILINKTGVVTIHLDCWAPYPIDLRFSGHLTNQETKVKTFRKEFDKKTCFLINATMESFEQITGNYTCFSVENPRLSSSYYVYVSPSPPGVLLTRGQSIMIKPKPWDKYVIFPCAVSHPDVHVHLLRHERILDDDSGVKYDPKVGFKMNLDLNDHSVYGNYSCKTELSPNDQVHFILKSPAKFQVDPPTRHIHLSLKEILNVSCQALDDFTMDIEPMRQIDIKYVSQTTHFKYFGQLISDQLEENAAGYVHCKWKHSNEPFATWAFSVTGNGAMKPGQLDARKIFSSCPNSSDVIFHECSNFPECRINACLRKDASCGVSKAYHCPVGKEKSCVRSGFLQCSTEASSLETFFVGFPSNNKSNRYVDRKYASIDELLYLELAKETYTLAKKSKSKENSAQLLFSCQGSNFVFSSGFKWSVVYKNGSKLMLTNGDKNMNFIIQNSLREVRSNLESTLRLTAPISVMRNITAVECSAPVWDSWDWIQNTLSINIEASFKNYQLRSGASLYCSSLYMMSIVVFAFVVKHILQN